MTDPARSQLPDSRNRPELSGFVRTSELLNLCTHNFNRRKLSRLTSTIEEAFTNTEIKSFPNTSHMRSDARVEQDGLPSPSYGSVATRLKHYQRTKHHTPSMRAGHEWLLSASAQVVRMQEDFKSIGKRMTKNMTGCVSPRLDS